MIYDNFKLVAFPHITDAYCKCGETLREVSNGFLSTSMYCPRCENVYQIKLIKVPPSKITEKYLKQCREETAPKKKVVEG